jgi:hypothetical protein
MRNSVKSWGSHNPGKAKNYGEAQTDNDYVDGECYSEILGLRTGTEQVGESHCWSVNWFETNQFMCWGCVFVYLGVRSEEFRVQSWVLRVESWEGKWKIRSKEFVGRSVGCDIGLRGQWRWEIGAGAGSLAISDGKPEHRPAEAAAAACENGRLRAEVECGVRDQWQKQVALLNWSSVADSVSNEIDESDGQDAKQNEQRIWTWRGIMMIFKE